MMAATDRAIRVGGVMPLSRPGFLEAGRHLKAGLELAVADVNGLGDVGGASFAPGCEDGNSNEFSQFPPPKRD